MAKQEDKSWYDPGWSQGKKTVTGAVLTLLTGMLPVFGLDLPPEVIQGMASIAGFLIIVGIAGKIDRKK